MDKIKILNEIKAFLEGYNDDLKYLVNVECDPKVNFAECVVHPPNGPKEIQKITYTPFMYSKDLKKLGKILYNGDEELQREMEILYGITIEKMKTGNQKRLEEGYCYKITSHKSFRSITDFFRSGGFDPYLKATDDEGNNILDKKGDPIFLNRDMFYNVKPVEQFLIDKRARLFKGFEDYSDVHRLTLDIETTGLRPEISRVFAVGVRDNKGFEKLLEVEKTDDDASEVKLIQDVFNLIVLLAPAIVCGYHSEGFDFPYLISRAKILKFDMSLLDSTLKKDKKLKRNPRGSVKIGGTTEKYVSTEIWGMSVIDIQHAAKKTAAVNSDIKNTKLKYIAKHEEIARDNRTYIPGEDNDIGRYYHENPFFVANDNNVHIEVPEEYQKTAERLFHLQAKKGEISEVEYKKLKKYCLDQDPEFIEWYKKDALPDGMYKFIEGKVLVRQYLSDDLYETEAIDELYNQSSFMLAKIVPTAYARVCTMGTASIWNLLLTAWSFEKGLAIPHSDKQKKFSGGLARCYKTGFSVKIIKIDYASLYPFEQLTWGIFPLFDITAVFEQMLMYMTTTRNIYKKLATSDALNDDEIMLMKSIDHETFVKYTTNTLTSKERAKFKVKQLPIKVLNNSQFGALGSGPSFNWSDNDCAAHITCNGRLDLRHAITWFRKFGCVPLLAVTDGVNFSIPDTTNISVDGAIMGTLGYEAPIEEMWKYDGKVGISALIAKFNKEEMIAPYMSVDNDGEFISCLNLSRINYALLQVVRDKKTGEVVIDPATGKPKTKVKLTGNTIKSKTMPEYIEDFIDKGLRMILEGKGADFVDYYNDYVDNIYYRRIPLKKIASKSRMKHTLKAYVNRGKDKNGREKGKQAHMELILRDRERIAEEIFQERKESLVFTKEEEKLTIKDKMKLVEVYMPQAPELDSTLYYYNTGYRKSHGDSKIINDAVTKEERFASTLISPLDLLENPDMTGQYNVDKYLDAFNNRVESLLVGFDPEIAEKIPAFIVRKKGKDEEFVKSMFTRDQLVLKNFDSDDYDESMYLEEKEVAFWNDTGFDPRKVWGGFKLHEDMQVNYEVYSDALEFLNVKMREVGKPDIKSRNEKINKGDYVLIKSGYEHSIGYNNGDFIEIVKANVWVPKSDVEIKREEKAKKLEEEVKKLDTDFDFKSNAEAQVEQLSEKRNKHFPEFKEKFGITEDTFGEFQLNTDGMGAEMLDEYIEFISGQKDGEPLSYLGVD